MGMKWKLCCSKMYCSVHQGKTTPLTSQTTHISGDPDRQELLLEEFEGPWWNKVTLPVTSTILCMLQVIRTPYHNIHRS